MQFFLFVFLAVWIVPCAHARGQSPALGAVSEAGGVPHNILAAVEPRDDVGLPDKGRGFLSMPSSVRGAKGKLEEWFQLGSDLTTTQRTKTYCAVAALMIYLLAGSVLSKRMCGNHVLRSFFKVQEPLPLTPIFEPTKKVQHFADEVEEDLAGCQVICHDLPVAAPYCRGAPRPTSSAGEMQRELSLASEGVQRRVALRGLQRWREACAGKRQSREQRLQRQGPLPKEPPCTFVSIADADDDLIDLELAPQIQQEENVPLQEEDEEQSSCEASLEESYAFDTPVEQLCQEQSRSEGALFAVALAKPLPEEQKDDVVLDVIGSASCTGLEKDVRHDIRAMKVMLCMQLGSGCERLNKIFTRQALQRWRDRGLAQRRAEAETRLARVVELLGHRGVSQPLRHWRGKCFDRRISTDGGAYTRKEFISFFGLGSGALQWVEAPQQAFYDPMQRRAAIRIQARQRGIVARAKFQRFRTDIALAKFEQFRMEEELAEFNKNFVPIPHTQSSTAMLAEECNTNRIEGELAKPMDAPAKSSSPANRQQEKTNAKAGSKDFLKPDRYAKKEEFQQKLDRLKGRISSSKSSS